MDATLAAYIAATAALVLTPGASTTVVVRNALDGGWRSGLATATGIAVANSTHAVLTGAGVGGLLHGNPTAIMILRVLGAVYLGWLGVGSFRRAWAGDRSIVVAAIAGTATSAGAGFREGLMVNLLNPAIMTFYLVIVPSFMPAGAGAAHYTLLATIHVSMAFVCHLGWSGLFDQIRRAPRQTTIVRTLDFVAGVALIVLAARTVVTA